MGDAEAKLKSKFAQLKAKREAKQQQQQQSGDGAASSAAHGGQPSGALSGILQQMEGSKAHNDDAKIDEKEPGSVVKASALDRSAIEAFQALRVPAGGEPPAKRAKGPGAAGTCRLLPSVFYARVPPITFLAPAPSSRCASACLSAFPLDGA
jgi:hypothetical protein